MLPVTRHPAASYWPYTPDASSFFWRKVGKEEKKNRNEADTAKHVHPFLLITKLTATTCQPLGAAVGLTGQSLRSATATTQTHTLASALSFSEYNLLSLCLTHSHPSITETEGKTIDNVCKHHRVTAATEPRRRRMFRKGQKQNKNDGAEEETNGDVEKKYLKTF